MRDLLFPADPTDQLERELTEGNTCDRWLERVRLSASWDGDDYVISDEDFEAIFGLVDCA
jgi:hypothetical protein